MTKSSTFFKNNFFKSTLLCAVLIFTVNLKSFCATYTSNAVTGNWSSGSSWVGGIAPSSSSDVVIIVSGANITVDANESCTSLTINAAAAANTLLINGGITLTVSGAITLNSPTSAVTSALNVGDGTLVCGSISIPGSATANHIALVTVATGSINCFGNITFSGTAARAQLTITGGGTINIQGNMGAGGTFNANGSGIVNFNGVAAQTAAGYTYYTFNADNSTGVTLTSNATITNLNIGDVTLNSVFNDGGFIITPAAGNSLNLNSGTYNLGSAGVATIWPAWISPTISTGTIVAYVSGVAQTVSAAPPYQYLNLTGAGIKTVATGTNVLLDWNVNSPTAINGASVTVSGNVNGAGAISATTGTIYVAGNWTNAGTLTGTGTVNFNGGSNQTINTGLTSVTFYNVEISGGQNLNVSAPTTLMALNNLLLTNGNFAAPNALTVNGSVTLNSGSFIAGASISIGGNWTDNDGGFVPGTSVVTFTGNSSSITTAAGINDQTFYDIVVAKTAGQTLTVNLPSSLTINNFTETTGNFSFTTLLTLNINGNALLSSGTFKAGNVNTANMNINLAGNWTNNDATAIVASTSIVTFTGNSATIAGSVTTTFYVLTIADGANITANTGFNCTTLNVGYGSSGTLGLGAQTILVTGSATSPNDGITINGGAVLSLTTGAITDKWDFNNYGTFTAGTSTVTFSVANIAANQTKYITGTDPQFYNLTIAGAGAGEMLDATQVNPMTIQNNLTLTTGGFTVGGQIYIGGSWSMATGAVFNNNNGIITFNGNGAQSITGTATPQIFYDVEIANTAGIVTANSPNLTIADRLFIDNTANFASAPALNINISNIWENDGGNFLYSTGTVTFNGSGGSSTITTNGNSPNQTFNNIVIATTGPTNVDATPLSSLIINGNFILTTGGFNAPSAMTITGSTFLNGGTFNANTQLFIRGNWNQTLNAIFANNNGLVTFNGNGAQLINGPATSETFYDVEIGDTGTLTMSNALSLVIMDNLTFDANASLTSGNLDTLYIGYQWINNGGTFNPSTGTVNFNGGWYNYITGSATTATFNNLITSQTGLPLWLDATALSSMNVNGNFTMLTGGLNPPVTMTVGGNVELISGTFFAPTTILNVGGNWINNGDGGARGSFDTYDCSCNSLVNFDGAAAQAIAGTATAQTFSDITVNKAGVGAAGTLTNSTVTNLLINDNFTLTSGTFLSTIPNDTITINNSGSPSSFTFTGGTFQVTSPKSIVTVNGPGSQTGGNVISGGTVNYFDPNQSGQTVITGSYTELVFDDNSKTLSPGTINISDTLKPGTGTNYTTTGNTIAFTGNASQIIPTFNYDGIATGTGYGNLSCSTTKIFGGNIAVNRLLWYAGGIGNLTLDSINILIGDSGSISGIPGPGHMVVLNGTGRLIKAITSGAPSYTYPIGPAAGVYMPVTLAFNNVYFPGDVGVTLNHGVDPNAVAPPNPASNWLQEYWMLDPNTTGISFDYYSATVKFVPADYNTNLTAGAGGESTMGAMLWNGNNWLTNAVVTTRTPLNPTTSYISTLGDLTFATCTPLAKTSDPTSQYVCVSGTSSVSFPVGISGTPAGYQWYQNGVSVLDTGIFSGAHSPQLLITNGSSALNGNKYYCVVTAECSGSFTSDTATIYTVSGLPDQVDTIYAVPSTYHPGDTVLLIAKCTTGIQTDLHFLFWEAFGQNEPWLHVIQNTTSDTLLLDNVSAYGNSIKSPGVTWLFVRSDNACGEVISFKGIYIEQVIPPTASSNPTMCGDTDGYISFAGLIPNNLYSILSMDKNGVPLTPFNLTTTANGVLIIPNLGAGVYSNIVLQVLNQGSSSPTAPADPVTLYDPCGGLAPFTVTYNNGVSTLGGTVNVCSGITNIGMAYADTGVTYSLYQGSALVDTYTPTSFGAFNFQYTPLAGDTYTVKGTLLPNTVSMNGTVIVNASPVAVISNSGLTGCANPGVVLGTTGSSAGSGNISSYQWVNSSGNINGATGSTFTATQSDNYSVIITNSKSCSTTSGISSVAVNANPLPVVTYSSLMGCANTGVLLSAAGSEAGSGAISSYQWNNSNGGISGANDTTYTATSTDNYSVVITNSNSCSSTSSINSVIINASPVATISYTSLTGCSNSGIILGTVGSTAGSGTISSYQWSDSSGNIIGATDSTYTATATGNYSVVVSNSNSCTASAAVNGVTVSPGPTAVISYTSLTGCVNTGVLLTTTGSKTGGGIISSYQWSNINGPISGATDSSYTATATGNYSVLITNSNSCSAVSSVASVTVNPNPIPPALTSGDSIICSGDSTQVCATGGGAYSYLWNTGDTTSCTFATQAGGYWVTVTAQNGCIAISSHKEIAAYSVSSVAIIVQGDTLSSFGAVGYQWYFNATKIEGATLSFYVAKETGYYSVEITDSHGCQALSSSELITVTGISEITNEAVFVIFPNPASNEINLIVAGQWIGKEYSIYDVCGKLVKAGLIEQEKSTLDISEMASGIYFVKSNSYTQKFMKL